MKQFTNLAEVIEFYKSEDKCRDLLEKNRWPDGNIICRNDFEGNLKWKDLIAI